MVAVAAVVAWIVVWIVVWIATSSGTPRLAAGEAGARPEDDSAAPPFAAPEDAIAVVRSEATPPSDTPTVPEDDGLWSETPGGPTQRERSIVLHVRDRETGEELRSCEVFANRDDSGSFSFGLPTEVPPEKASVIGAADSPLQLRTRDARRDVTSGWVKVPGYETGHLRLAWSAGGSRTIELRAAGNVTVEVVGAPPELALVAQLHDADALLARLEGQLARRRHLTAEEPAIHASWIERLEASVALLSRRAECERIGERELSEVIRSVIPGSRHLLSPTFTTAAPVQIAGVGCGDWIVVVNAAKHSPSEFVGIATDDSAPANAAELGSATGFVRVSVGESTRLRLDWQPKAWPATAPLIGRIEFAREWLAPGMPPLPTQMHVRSLHPAAKRTPELEGRAVELTSGSRPEERRFDAGELEAGGAAAWFRDLHWSTWIEVLPQAAAEIVIVVPPPCHVTLHAHAPGRTDIQLGAWANDEAHDDSRAAPPFSPGGGDTSRDGEPLEFVVPRGNLTVRLIPKGGPLMTQSFLRRLESEAAEITFEMREPAWLAVTLREGDAVVPADIDWYSAIDLTGPDASLRVSSWMKGGGEAGFTMMIDGEGSATLTTVAVGDWLPIVPLPVDLVRGELVSIDVPLVRARR